MRIKRPFILLFLLAISLTYCQFSFAQIGTWKDYMAYYEVQDVKRGGNILYVLASNDLYSYNENDNSIQTYDKVNGLSDCSISNIEWNNTVKKLFILYNDYNIDILDANGNVTNISDYYNASLSSNKTVYDIYMDDRFAYLSTGFGIVKIDMRDYEVTNTYNLRFRVDYCYVDGNYIYAASSTNGLYRGSLSANLLDPGSWTRVGSYTRKNYTVDPQLLAIAEAHRPEGPKYNYFYFSRFKYGSLYTVGGGYSPSADIPRPGMVQVYTPSTDTWTIYEDSLQKKTGYLYQANATVDVDPTDHSRVMVGSRTGLYEFRNGNFVQHWNSENSPLENAVSPNYTLILGGAFDDEGNYWFGNSQAQSQSLWEYTHDGQFVNKHKSDFMTSPNLSFAGMRHFFFDRDKNLWFVNYHFISQDLVYYQPSTNGDYVYNNWVNEDGTIYNRSFSYVYCAAQDLDGNIWVGTQIGPFYIPYNEITTPPSDMIFQQYKVPRNDGTDLADYLLSGVPITCMAIDGGNRKWFGTEGSGVYLISADNNTEIHHFMANNSGLLSDIVESISIDPSTGEVFFGTENGLCSYMSDATQTVDKMDKDVTYAYPNPVKPGYTGPITIVGLTYNADVKIVTTNGVLVAEGRSNGGSFVWDGTDLNGKRVASGVYMVQTATQDGDKGTVCKIAVVN